MRPIGRRSVFAAALAAATSPAAAAMVALRDAARRAGLLLGAASEVDLATEPDYAALFTRQCDLLAPNLSWQRVSPEPAGPLARIDGSVAVAVAAGLRLTGYHLLWHHRMPAWLEPLGPAEAEHAIVAHIAAMASAFGRNSFSWNVVNEAIDGDGLRRSPLSQKFGSAFFDLAYHAAQSGAPDVLRVYNDYDLELATPEHERRRAALLRLLDVLQARGVPLQAVGLQCHLRTGNFDRFDPAVFRQFLSELTRRGLTVLITELDVFDLATGDIAVRDRRVADIYHRFLETALQERIGALVFWGLTDRHSWLNDPNRASFRRPDGTPGRPLLFDRDLTPKPALDAVLATLRPR